MRPSCVSAHVLGVVALAACLRSIAAMAPAPRPSTLQPALGAARLEDAAGVAQELKTLGLSQLQDVRLLDAGEAAEMMGALRGAAVSLGDRSRLRRMLAGPAITQRAVVGASKISTDLAESEVASGHRAVQQESAGLSSGGAVSGDSLAIAATVLVALVGYAVCPVSFDYFRGSFLEPCPSSKRRDARPRRVSSS